VRRIFNKLGYTGTDNLQLQLNDYEFKLDEAIVAAKTADIQQREKVLAGDDLQTVVAAGSAPLNEFAAGRAITADKVAAVKGAVDDVARCMETVTRSLAEDAAAKEELAAREAAFVAARTAERDAKRALADLLKQVKERVRKEVTGAGGRGRRTSILSLRVAEATNRFHGELQVAAAMRRCEAASQALADIARVACPEAAVFKALMQRPKCVTAAAAAAATAAAAAVAPATDVAVVASLAPARRLREGTPDADDDDAIVFGGDDVHSNEQWLPGRFIWGQSLGIALQMTLNARRRHGWLRLRTDDVLHDAGGVEWRILLPDVPFYVIERGETKNFMGQHTIGVRLCDDATVALMRDLDNVALPLCVSQHWFVLTFERVSDVAHRVELYDSLPSLDATRRAVARTIIRAVTGDQRLDVPLATPPPFSCGLQAPGSNDCAIFALNNIVRKIVGRGQPFVTRQAMSAVVHDAMQQRNVASG
jgi:hypothetical protein